MGTIELLTREILALYAGGEVQIDDHQKEKQQIGSIKTLQITEMNQMIISLNWLASADQYPPRTWTYENQQEIRINLDDYNVYDYGKHNRDTESRLSVQNKKSSQSLLFFSAEMPNKLDERCVRGLPTKEDC